LLQPKSLRRCLEQHHPGANTRRALTTQLHVLPGNSDRVHFHPLLIESGDNNFAITNFNLIAGWKLTTTSSLHFPLIAMVEINDDDYD
jgi:hypothetical protein